MSHDVLHQAETTPLKEGDEMTADDAYGVFFEAVQESFVYVFQQDARGKIDILFPNPQVTPQTNPVPAGKAVWVPQDTTHWFYLDEHVGREIIIIAASLRRDERLESLLQRTREESSQSELAQWLFSPERGVGGIRQIETTSQLSPGGKALNLETALVQGRDIDFVYKIEFQHK